MPATIVKYVPSTSSLMAAAVARFAASNFSNGDCIEVEQSMMMASTRSRGAASPDSRRDIISGGDADDRVDRPGSLGEIGIVVDINGDAENVAVQLNS